MPTCVTVSFYLEEIWLTSWGLVAGYAQGNAFYAQEACKWLSDQGHLETLDNGTVGLRDSFKSHGIAPPSLQNIAQSLVDQLPAGLVLILRCASAFGTVFRPPLLLKLVQKLKTATGNSLRQQLETLQQLKILAPSSTVTVDLGGGVTLPDKWTV